MGNNFIPRWEASTGEHGFDNVYRFALGISRIKREWRDLEQPHPNLMEHAADTWKF